MGQKYKIKDNRKKKEALFLVENGGNFLLFGLTIEKKTTFVPKSKIKRS